MSSTNREFTHEELPMKKFLAETNPYLRDEKKRLADNRLQALESSFFEGARGLKLESAESGSLSPRVIATQKKSDKTA